MLFQGSPDDCLPVADPRSMDDRTPAPSAVAPFAMDDLSAAGAELPVVWQRSRPDPGNDFFGSPECRPLLIRIGRDDPCLPLSPARSVDWKEAKLSVGVSPAAHVRPAASSAVQRFAEDRPEAQKHGAPVRDLMRDHHRPRATRVRIPYAPLRAAWTRVNRMVAWVTCALCAGNVRRVRTPVRTRDEPDFRRTELSSLKATGHGGACGCTLPPESPSGRAACRRRFRLPLP